MSAEIEDFYRKHGERWDASYVSGSDSTLAVRRDYVCALARDRSARRALDVGCGAGHLVAELERRGVSCDGLDLSREMLERAERNRPDGSRGVLLAGNAEVLADVPEGPYDLINASGLFVHEIDEDAVLSNLRARLRAGGSVVASFRNELFALFSLNAYTLDFYAELLRRTGAPEHVSRQVLSDLESACAKRGAGTTDFERDHRAIFRRLHNPLAIRDLFSRNGLRVEEVFYLHMHPAPPALLSRVPDAERLQDEMQRAYARSWEGAFFASAFLAHATPA